MAKIRLCSIGYSTEGYVAVYESEYGFISGRLHNGNLHDLRNPWVWRTLDRNSDQVVAAFETREELEQWLAAVPRGLKELPAFASTKQAREGISHLSLEHVSEAC